MSRGAANDSAPAFPVKAVAAGVAAMVLIAIVSAVITWIVGERIRTITSSQIAVLTAAESLQRDSETLEMSARMAVVTGDETYARRYGAVQPELRETLRRLEQAIRLPENREAFAAVDRAEREIAEIEYRALDLAVADRREEAERILGTPRYRALVAAYRSGLDAIERRSRAYVQATRAETDRYITINLGTSVFTLLLIALAWVVLVRPARTWASQLAETRQRAENATRAKSDFLAVMSHEIRTPLNSIIGFADLLLTDPALRGAQRRQVELIHGGGAMLLTVVNDLLDFSKIEAGRVELVPEPFPIETLVDNSVSIVRPSAEAKGLEMRVAIDPCLPLWLLGDEDRLRQVLLNLLNNAVKFTAEGLVSLSVAGAGRDGDRLRIRFTVTDTGVGIDPESQQQLFQPFAQADASITRRYGGTGLGLSISRRLVELMGGEIGFLSNPGHGSSFWFTVSLPPSEAPDIAPAAPQGGRAEPAHILVAEDLPMNQELARAMVERAGHRVEIVGDGAQAVRAAAGGGYDLVLMDIQMPVMDGLAATREIRRLPPPAGAVPIVAMTANVLPHQVAEFLAAGMNGHVAKPVKQRELQSAIASALASRPRRERPPEAPAPEPEPEDLAFEPATFDGVCEAIPPERLLGYVRDLDATVAAVAAASAAGDCAAIAGDAHRIVSQAGMLGLPRLSERARALEDACRAGDGIEPALASFRTAAGDLRTHILPRLADPGGETGPPKH